jgi:polar amino acid transport system permease protein
MRAPVLAVVASRRRRLAADPAQLLRRRHRAFDVARRAAHRSAQHVLYTALAFSFGLVLGLVLALMRLSSIAPYRWFATVYIEVFRGLPALLTIFLVGFGIPIAFQVRWPILAQITLGLGIVAAAYMAETIRAGIEGVPKGQMEAARSLGMSRTRAMVSIVIPQGFRIIIPPLTNELVLLIKDTSLLFVLGTTPATKELTKFGRDVLAARRTRRRSSSSARSTC